MPNSNLPFFAAPDFVEERMQNSNRYQSPTLKTLSRCCLGARGVAQVAQRFLVREALVDGAICHAAIRLLSPMLAPAWLCVLLQAVGMSQRSLVDRHCTLTLPYSIDVNRNGQTANCLLGLPVSLVTN
jgi:hypothetical protein